MNVVSSVRSEKFPTKSRIPVAAHPLKSKIPVQVSKLSNLNDKTKRNVPEKKPLVSSQSQNVKKTAFTQKSCTLVEKLQKPVIKSKGDLGNKTVTSTKPKLVKGITEHTLKNDNKNTKFNKTNINQTTTKNLAQVNEQKSKSKLNKGVKKTVPKENKDPLKSSHKDDFAASEYFRNMILSGRELSPRILKSQPGVKLSSVQCERPSIYKKFELSANPSQDAIREAQKLSLSLKKNRVSSVKKESKPSLPVSPFKLGSLNRQSFYTPCSNPQEEVLRDLQAFKERRQLKKSKSAKKVTFNLTVEECTPKIFSNRVQTPFKNAEGLLTQIIEKSEENTPNSPESKVNEAFSLVRTQQSNPQISESENSDKGFSTLCSATKSTSVTQQGCTETPPKITVPEYSELCTPMTKLSISSLSNVRDNAKTFKDIFEDSKKISDNILFHSLRKFDNNVSSPDFLSDNVRKIISLTCEKTKSFCTSVPKNETEQDFEKSMQAKVYTPCPVSLYSKSRLINSSSPEFLPTDRRLSQYAPIRTPLVLKTMAKSPGSPETKCVRLKLDFTDEKKDSPKKCFTKSTSSVILQKIETLQKKLDNLADEECHLLLVNESTTPVVCGRYLQNPVALTLSEGDDMHFIPIAF